MGHDRHRGPFPGIGLLSGPQEVFGGAYVRDSLTALLDLLLMSIALLTILFGPDYLRPRGLPAAEFATMLLLRDHRGHAHRRRA